jgi:two-component system, NarL family, sensor histidine kinase DesK
VSTNQAPRFAAQHHAGRTGRPRPARADAPVAGPASRRVSAMARAAATMARQAPSAVRAVAWDVIRGPRLPTTSAAQLVADSVALAVASVRRGPGELLRGMGEEAGTVIEPTPGRDATRTATPSAVRTELASLWLPAVVAVGLLFFLIQPLERVIHAPLSDAARAATLACLVAYAGVYLIAVVGDILGRRSNWLPAAVVALTALAVAVTVIDGRPMWTILFVGAAAGAGRLRGGRAALGGILLAAAAATATSLTFGTESLRTLESTIEVLLVGLVVLGFSQADRTTRQLQAAQAEVARAATDRERARIARDLHDLLGHSLSMVALKTELAGKLIGRDPDRAAAELAEVEEIVRTSLRDVRQAVAGYRAVDLETELGGARVALTAAGFDVLIERPEAPLDASTSALLGWAVREAATNVVRHSGGGQCSIEVARAGDSVRLEVLDDGPVPGPGLPVRVSVGTGRGLQGLRERVEQAGGSMAAGWRPGVGYALTITVPATPPAPIEEGAA